MSEILSNVNQLSVIFSIHQRIAKIIECLKINAPYLHIVEPLGYLEFNYLVHHAKAVLTDSGKITEETTVMGVPCLTLRDNTERPETITIGVNKLIGTNPKNIKPALDKLFSGNWEKGGIPYLWNGKAAKRIVE
jgi:UDP-N-acetylglucosamine 2-epimerase (non-hydrolysing)